MYQRNHIILPLGALAFILVTVLSVWSILQLQEAITFERRANQIQGEVDDLYELVLEAKESPRGFQKSVPRIPETLDRLKRRVANDPWMSKQVSNLDSIIGKILDDIKLSHIETDHGAELMEDLRAVLNQIDLKAKAQAGVHERFFRRYSTYVLWTIGGGAIFGLLLIGAFAYLTRKEIIMRMRTEEQLRAAQDAALVASKMKSQFLATVSHEVRTPLNGIIGMSDLLRDKVANTEGRRYVEIIHSAGQALLKIVNEILDFSKIEAGRMEFELSEFSILELTEMNSELFSVKAREKGLSLYSYIDPALPKLVVGDSARISQILRNLISNAVKFTPQGGILVRAFLRFRAGTKTVVRFEVQDTGPGISLEQQSLLFQPFNQLHRHGDIPEEGTGLGLSICKELSERMGGHVGVESELGRGSVFWFELPLKAASEALIADLDPIDPLKRKILGISRSPVFDRLLSYYAGEFKLELQIVEDIGSVTEQEIEDQFVIIDLDSTDDLQNLERAYSNKLIMFTRDIRGHHNHKSVLEKAQAILQKPVSRSQLKHVLSDSPIAPEGKADDAETLRSEKLWDEGAEPPLVLVAEDNSSNQILIEALLKELGCRVHLVANGQEAIEALSRIAYDLVFMDCQMPVQNGFEATKAIRMGESNQRRRVPIIALTANASSQDREFCLASGMDDFLAKPFDKTQLSKVLQTWTKTSLTTAIEWAALQKLAKATNPDVVRKMVASFIQTLEKSISQLENAKANEDLNEIRQWAHHLRSSSAILGAVALANACARVETEVEKGLGFSTLESETQSLIICARQTQNSFKERADTLH